MAEKIPDSTLPEKQAKRPLFFRLLRAFALFFGIVLCIVVVALVGFSLWIRTDSARELVHKELNAKLPPLLASQGLRVTIKELHGTLPFDFETSLDVFDSQGLFFTAPKTRFSLDLGLFPPSVTVEQLRISDASLLRMPHLPEKKPEEPKPQTKPLKPCDLVALLSDISETIVSLPSKIPHVAVRKTGLENFSLPKEILGFPAKVTLLLDVESDFSSGVPSVSFSIPKLALNSQDLTFSGTILWKSGTKKEDWIGGDTNIAFVAKLNPQAFVKEPDVSPVTSSFSLTGSLLAPAFSLKTSCNKLSANGQTLEDIVAQISSKKIDLLAFLGEKPKPVTFDVHLASQHNKKPLHFAVKPFACLITNQSFETLSAGFSHLDLAALGVKAKGAIKASLGHGLPKVTGTLDAAIADFSDIEAFVPDIQLAGSLSANVDLRHDGKKQDGSLNLSIPNFNLRPKGGDALAIDACNLRCNFLDILQKGSLDADFSAKKIATGPLSLSCSSQVAGNFTGPLSLRLATKGSVETTIAAQWREGLVNLNTLSVTTNPALFAKEFKNAKTLLGVHLRKAVTLQYGSSGFSFSPLNIDIVPAGKLRAHGGIQNSQCNFDVNLDALDLAAWQSLVADLPKGVVRLMLALHGNLAAPKGNLRVSVDKLHIPGTKLAPLDLALLGDIGNVFDVRLEVPKKTVASLGGKNLEVSAKIPLAFQSNGVPSVPPSGKLSGNVVWKGKLAPLWKFSPLQDAKLTGDLDVNIQLGGTVKSPSVKGLVAVANTRFEDPIQGVLLRDIFCNVGIDGKVAENGLGGGITLKAGVSDGMGGTIKVDGTTPLDASKLDIRTKIDHLRPLRRQDIRISLSGDVLVAGSAAAPEVTGKIIVNNGAVQLENIEKGPSGVTVLPIAENKPKESKKEDTGKSGKKEKKSTQTSAGPGKLDLKIISPGRFLVDGFGLSTEWKTAIAITGTPTNPIIDGEVAAVKGSMDFLNKIFTLDKGIVTLNADNIANPLLDIRLANTSSGITSYIQISGTVKKMKLSLTSDPPMPQDDVMAHILFGRNANELGRSEALQLAAAMARLASGLGSGLNSSRKTLGMDVMRLKSGGQKGQSDNDKWVEGMALESGKYINDYIYVGVEQGVKQNSTAGIIQLEITPKLKLEMRTQQNETKGSLNWKHDY